MFPRFGLSCLDCYRLSPLRLCGAFRVYRCGTTGRLAPWPVRRCWLFLLYHWTGTAGLPLALSGACLYHITAVARLCTLTDLPVCASTARPGRAFSVALSV